MTDVPERICPDCGSRHYARCAELREDGKYHPGSILRCIECKTTYLDPALAKSPHVQALVKAAVEAERSAGAPVDVDTIEKSGKRWHGEDHRVVSVRWEPYKPDGARQMKTKGRWQEQVGSGDYWRWQNCDRPAAIREVKP